MSDNSSIVSAEPTFLLDLSAHGRIRCTGEDRARLVHALSTNHVQQLTPGQGVYAYFLSAQGRILSDAHILCFAASLLLDVEPETREAMLRHVDHYIIADDVTLEDETGQTFSLGVEGPGAEAFLTGLSAPLPHAREAHLSWENMTVAAIDATGAGGYRLYGPATRKNELWQRLLQAGAVAEDAEPLRIAHYHPKYGVDITEKTLPQETGDARALHFQKGCYLGQEIVERIRSRGHVNRMLSGLLFGTDQAPEAGTKIFEGGTEVGEITSAWGRHALAMLRLTALKPGVKVTAAGRTATTHPIRF